ncbi:MAG: Holliday junction branch migration DNA helicase RuvB [Fimbriimonadales bacterium]
MEEFSERLVDGKQLLEEADLEPTIRPKRLDEFVGQNTIKVNLSVFIAAAKARSEPLDHVLLKGPPGLGKTTLGFIIANEMDATIRITSGPAIEKQGDLAAILTNIEEGSVLFIDEIHRLSRPVEEILYPAMEDFQLDIVIGKGPGAHSIRLALPRFTIVGATTRAGLLTGPLRDRFGIVHNFEYYEKDALETIIKRSARIFGYTMTDEGAAEVALRSRGTPRVANRLLRRTRDFAQHLSKEIIDEEVARFALDRLEIDVLGLDRIDRSILSAIIEKFGGGPVGVETLSATISEDSGTIEEVYEPFLIQQGFLQRTPRGRMATEAAYKFLGKEGGPQKNLF